MNLPDLNTPNEKPKRQIFHSEKRQELADNLNKANFGNPQNPFYYNAKMALERCNDIGIAYIIYNFLGKDHLIYDPNEKLWIREFSGIYDDISEGEVKARVYDIVADVVKCGEDDSEQGRELAAKFVNTNFCKGVFENLRDKCVGTIMAKIPNGFCIIKDRAYDLEKRVYLNEVPKIWRAKKGLTIEPGKTSDGEFTEFLTNLCNPDGALIIKKYLGSMIWGENLTKKFLFLEGSPDSGKSQIFRVIEKLLHGNYGSLRPAHLSSRFELDRVWDKKILFTPDINPKAFLDGGANALKEIVGGDPMTTEGKYAKKGNQFNGTKHMMFGGNDPLEFPADENQTSYLTRTIRVPCKKYFSSDEEISDFGHKMVEKEGDKIVKWLLEGAELYLQDVKDFGNLKLSPDLLQLVKEMAHEEKQDVYNFVKVGFKKVNGGFTSTKDANEWIANNSSGGSTKKNPAAIKAEFNMTAKVKKISGIATRGYEGLAIVAN